MLWVRDVWLFMTLACKQHTEPACV
jgi:hypothetical protein